SDSSGRGAQIDFAPQCLFRKIERIEQGAHTHHLAAAELGEMGEADRKRAVGLFMNGGQLDHRSGAGTVDQRRILLAAPDIEMSVDVDVHCEYGFLAAALAEEGKQV